MKNKDITLQKGDTLFAVLKNGYTIFMLCIVIYPLIYVVSASISSPHAVITGQVKLLPVDITFSGYKTVFEYPKIWMGYFNTVIYTVIGTAINVVLTIIAAYPLSRKDLKGRQIIMFMIVFTMLFSGGLIPDYLLVYKLGLINSRWAMWIPNAIFAWNIIITRTFFQTTIPDELLEASKLDGCSDIKFITRIVISLSLPVIAVNVLFYSIHHWNSYFQAMLYLNEYSKYPLQIILREILVLNSVDELTDVALDLKKQEARELMRYSLIIIASLPILMVYPFIQKYFIKGIMIGSLKG